MEELFDGSLKGILHVAGVIMRSVIWLIWDLCFEIIAWYVGWPICRILSLGRYPQEAIGDYERAGAFTSIVVPLVGLAFLVSLAVGLLKLGGGA